MELVRRLEDHSHWTVDVTFSWDQKVCATAGYEDCCVCVYRVDEEWALWKRIETPGWVCGARFFPKRERRGVMSLLVSLAYPVNDLQLWNVETGECVRRFEGFGDFVLSPRWSSDGALCAAASHDRTCRVFDAQGTPVAVAEVESWAWVSVMSPNGRWLAVGEDSGAVSLYVLSYEVQGGGEEEREELDWQQLGVDEEEEEGGGREDVVVSGVGLELKVKLQEHVQWTASLAFSGDSRLLASGSTDCSAVVYDVDEEVVVSRLQGVHTDNVRVRFFPNGEFLMTASRDRSLAVWSCRDWSCVLHQHGVHGDSIGPFSFGLGGRVVATSSRDGTVAVWKVPLLCEDVLVAWLMGLRQASCAMGRWGASAIFDRNVVAVVGGLFVGAGRGFDVV